MKRSGQAAFEYLVIVVVVMAFIIPIWAYASGFQQDAQSQLEASYAQNAVRQIADAASLVYSQGPPARMDIQIFIPEGLQSILFINRTVIFRQAVGSSTNDIYEVSMAPLNGSLPLYQGTYWVTVKAMEGYVQVGLKE